MKKIYNLQSLNFLHSSKLRIAVLGGSFDPAHSGHLAISKIILEKYKFDKIIWLIAKQNPLKSEYYLSFEKRCDIAFQIVDHPRILISSLEHEIKSHFTYDIMSQLIHRFRNIEFTWIMGIDILQSFHKWKNSERFTSMCKIIILDRPENTRFANYSRFINRHKGLLAYSAKSSIMIDRCKLDSHSSTKIKQLH